ncbi:MAG: metal-dependent hydrolase [Pseudomonadota bacterium]
MKITWLGHAGFRIEIEDQVLLIDPWMTGNPVFPEDRKAEAVAGATQILVTHGHFDHVGDVVDLAKTAGIPVVGQYDLVSWWADTEGIEGVPFHKGGTVSLGDVTATMVPASHSSSLPNEAGPIYAGTAVGFVVRGEGRTIYVSGDTDIMADMAWMGEYYAPDIGILCAGGHFTMDMKAAAWAANKYFDFKTVIPCHYKTFPLLAQDADALRAGLPDVEVIEPEVLQSIEL